MTKHVAVVGSGVSGIIAAYALARTPGNRYRVTLFEAADRPGGHADTHLVPIDPLPTQDPNQGQPAQEIAIDTGFIVHNERTYPTLLRLFAELGVETQDSDMSMSVNCHETGLQWAGALGPRGLFPALSNITHPGYLRMLAEIPKFHRMAKKLLATERNEETLKEFLARGRFSPLFRTHFMESLVACVWSCDAAVSLQYPARYLFTFLAHHGMLQIFGSPQWRTVTGGSRSYVERALKVVDEVLLDTPVESVRTNETGVAVSEAQGQTRQFDAVVIATHPDQALTMLAEPTSAQRELLGAIPYSKNLTQLHTDESLMPANERTHASWNYLRRGSTSQPVTVTYDLTRLMRLPTTQKYLVTLGGADLVDPEKVIDTMDYEHPIYTPSSVAAIQRMDEADTDRIVFAGAWRGWGFHEDGAASGLKAAEKLGARWASEEPVPRVGEYRGAVKHTRRRPLRHQFTHRQSMWVVDLDALPDHGVLGRFLSRDHFGDPERDIKSNVESFLAQAPREPREHRDDNRAPAKVFMAAHARALGYCFNPISVYWCYDHAGTLSDVLVEVHNTYGDRHVYLVNPDERGRAQVDKALYVSPFNSVSGSYSLAVPVPQQELLISVNLEADEVGVFSANFEGEFAGETTFKSLLRTAPSAIKGAALIRLHGIALWLRRLPIKARPVHLQKGVQ